MKEKEEIDLSSEPDIEAIDLQDFKYSAGMEVDIVDDRCWPHLYVTAIVKTALDEIVEVKMPR
jgi:hypothetical protein